MMSLLHNEFRIEYLEDSMLKEKIMRDFTIKEKLVLEDMEMCIRDRYMQAKNY